MKISLNLSYRVPAVNFQRSMNPLKPIGHYMYRQFNIQQFYVLPHTAVFTCFVWILEQTAIISLYSINWLVCVTETECVYCAVRTEQKAIFPYTTLTDWFV